MKSNELFLAQVKPARQQLETWRKTRRHGERIPERLWISLVTLAGVHGVSPVAQALRLDYYALKRRVLESEPVRKSRPKEAAAFVELPWIGQPSHWPKCTVELAKNTGASMTIRWEGQAAVDVMGLAESFWRGGR